LAISAFIWVENRFMGTDTTIYGKGFPFLM